jgi:hypothetical protein
MAMALKNGETPYLDELKATEVLGGPRQDSELVDLPLYLVVRAPKASLTSGTARTHRSDRQQNGRIHQES